MPDPQFLTIRGFSNRPNGIRAGNVYQVDTVRFDLGNLTTVPYQRPIDVNVTVALAHWNEVKYTSARVSYTCAAKCAS